MLIATGSEVPLAIEAQKVLAAQGVTVRVVSMPSTTVFDRQDAAYKAGVLPEGLPRIAIEAGVTDFWWKYVRAAGAVLGVDRFGESAPAPAVYKHFGLTADNVVATVSAVIAKGKKMTIKIAINGYGRIGRNILRAHYEGGKKHDIQIVAINDLGDPKTNAHLTKYDTAHGPFPGTSRGGRRLDGRQRRPDQGARQPQPGRTAVGANSGWTSCSSAPASSPPRKRHPRT